jgi:hypothetical protein
MTKRKPSPAGKTYAAKTYKGAAASPYGAAEPSHCPSEDAIHLPCCKCVGGEGQTISINTGSAQGSVPWQVSGPGVTNPVAQTIVAATIDSQWTATLAPAEWVHPNDNNGGTGFPVGVYCYDLRIDVPKCTIPMEVLVSGEAAGDDNVRIFLDNLMVPIAETDYSIAVPSWAVPGDGGWGFKAERIVSFSGALTTPGPHLLRIEVTNGGGGPSGLLVRAALKTFCSTRLESC